jgi:hypothetical protein
MTPTPKDTGRLASVASRVFGRNHCPFGRPRLAALVLVAAGLLPSALQAEVFRTGVVYEFESQVAANKSLEVAGASTATGTSVQISTYADGTHQRWKAIDVGGGYWSFSPVHAPGLRLNVGGASSADGALVTQSTSNGTTAQKWKRYANSDGTYSFEPQCAPGKRLNVVGGGTANGTKAEIRTASTAASQKWKLIAIAGDYRPDASTTGPIAGITLTTVNADVNATADNQIIENKDIYGRVNTLSYSNVIVRNCIIRGTALTGADSETACIISNNNDSRNLLVEDCRLIGRGTPWCSATQTGRFIMRRTEISNVPDGIGLRPTIGYINVEACWIHNGFYMEWDASTPNRPYAGSYYTHVDGVQFHRGSNYVFCGNMIGGTRYVAGHHTGHEADIQNADDMYNACFMIKQETANGDGIPSASEIINNVLIEKNWLMGGQASINITKGAGGVNDFSTTIIRKNRFIRSTWGQQYYVLRAPNVGVFQDNVYDDDGTPVTISPGA